MRANSNYLYQVFYNQSLKRIRRARERISPADNRDCPERFNIAETGLGVTYRSSNHERPVDLDCKAAAEDVEILLMESWLRMCM